MTNDPLHDFVHKAISELPTRRAPRSLIDRVNAAIAMRAALPWHARGFAAWPASARILTVVARDSRGCNQVDEANGIEAPAT
jgi:hypothetical protein